MRIQTYIEHWPTPVNPKSFCQETPQKKNSFSDDGDASWTVAATVHPGPAAYSDLVQMDERTIGCLYEAGEKSPCEGIWFKTVSIGR